MLFADGSSADQHHIHSRHLGNIAVETIVIGEIAGVYGVKGWVRLKSWTQPAEQIFTYQPWLLVNDDIAVQRTCKVLEYRSHTGQFLINLEGVTDRDEAAKLNGYQVEVEKNRLPELPDNEYYWTDLIGMQVVNLDGEDLGKVSNLLETGANDVLVINGDRQRLVPFTQGQAVTEVNQAAGKITVDWDADF